MQRLAALALLAAVPTACLKSSGSQSRDPDYPKRTQSGAGDATATTKIATFTPGDGARLVIDVDRPPLPGHAAPWACYDLPPADFPVGRAVCAADPSKSKELVAGNFEITCRANPDYAAVDVRSAVDWSGCDSYEIHSYTFDPPLEMAVLKR